MSYCKRTVDLDEEVVTEKDRRHKHFVDLVNSFTQRMLYVEKRKEELLSKYNRQIKKRR